MKGNHGVYDSLVFSERGAEISLLDVCDWKRKRLLSDYSTCLMLSALSNNIRKTQAHKTEQSHLHLLLGSFCLWRCV